MLSRTPRHEDDAWDDADEESAAPRWWTRVLRALSYRPKELIAVALTLAGSLAVVINALFLQTGPHPAPIFAAQPLNAPVKDTTGSVVVLPRPRPPEREVVKVEAPAAPAAPRSRADIVGDIQRELAAHGFYGKPADGVYGSKTEAAIRDFERAAHLKPGSEPSEALLAALHSSHVKGPLPPRVLPAPAQTAPRPDPIADMISPSPRVLAAQRALAEFGYGQIKPTGLEDADTVAAIQKFERERKLPVDGAVSDRLLRELAAMTGRPLEF